MFRFAVSFLSLLLLIQFMSENVAQSKANSPKRIASGTVGTDEVLIELLSRRHELHRLIAVSIFSDNPQYSDLVNVPNSIKGRVGDSIEALLALKPDLAILASYNRLEIAQQLRAAGVQVIVQDNFRSITDIQANIRLIASHVGIDKEAEELLKEMNSELKASESLAACPNHRPSILQYSEHDTVPGLNTIFNDAVTRVGFNNLAAALKLEGWTKISQEILASMQPDFLVVAGDPLQKSSIIKKLQASVGWQKFQAIHSDRLIVVPERQLYSVSHHITKLVKALAKVRRCPIQPS